MRAPAVVRLGVVSFLSSLAALRPRLSFVIICSLEALPVAFLLSSLAALKNYRFITCSPEASTIMEWPHHSFLSSLAAPGLGCHTSPLQTCRCRLPPPPAGPRGHPAQGAFARRTHTCARTHTLPETLPVSSFLSLLPPSLHSSTALSSPLSSLFYRPSLLLSPLSFTALSSSLSFFFYRPLFSSPLSSTGLPQAGPRLAYFFLCLRCSLPHPPCPSVFLSDCLSVCLGAWVRRVPQLFPARFGFYCNVWFVCELWCACTHTHKHTV